MQIMLVTSDRPTMHTPTGGDKITRRGDARKFHSLKKRDGRKKVVPINEEKTVIEKPLNLSSAYTAVLPEIFHNYCKNNLGLLVEKKAPFI